MIADGDLRFSMIAIRSFGNVVICVKSLLHWSLYPTVVVCYGIFFS